MTEEVEKRIEELADALSALCEENHTACMCLCISGIPPREAFKMGVLQGERFLADLNASAESADGKVYVDIEKARGSTAFALGLIRAFTGTSIRMADDLEEMYIEDCLGEA